MEDKKYYSLAELERVLDFPKQDETAPFPRVDISETDDEIKVIAEMPGVDPDMIGILIADRHLYLCGYIQSDLEIGERPRRSERVHGEFCRSILLTERVEAEVITAEYKNGVLIVHLPKVERY
jgi:HSP20 family protein